MLVVKISYDVKCKKLEKWLIESRKIIGFVYIYNEGDSGKRVRKGFALQLDGSNISIFILAV